MKRLALLMLLLCTALTVAAQDPPTGDDTDTPVRYKLTVGYYQFSQGLSDNGPAMDLNLRQTSSLGNVWFAHYDSWAHGVTQTRLGWDRTWGQDTLRLIPSLQLASGGAWNGSLGAETGQTWFAGLAFGRTNLRDSLSLNFDPNDMVTLSGGYRWSEINSLSFQLVRDNRLHPDQQHLHLIYRTPLPDARRLTVDVLFKRGLVDDEPTERTGLTVTHDWPRWFIRAAWDPKTNFTSQDLLRLVVGTRF
jgi:hypothetical protein